MIFILIWGFNLNLNESFEAPIKILGLVAYHHNHDKMYRKSCYLVKTITFLKYWPVIFFSFPQNYILTGLATSAKMADILRRTDNVLRKN